MTSTAGSEGVRDRAAALGLAGKGVLYLLVGALAVRVALGGSGSGSQGQAGAIRSLAGEPFGQVLLWVLGIGLSGYALWRLLQALRDPDEESAAKAALMRASYAVRAVVYAGLALLTWQVLLGGSSSSGGSGGSQHATAVVLGWPGGRWLVGAAGLVVIGVGLYQGRKAISGSFMDDLALRGEAARHRTSVERLGRAGYASRTVVYCMIGAFLIQAARQFDPQQARGLDGALQELAQQPWGTAMLLVVALGLVAYGAYCLVVAPYLSDSDA